MGAGVTNEEGYENGSNPYSFSPSPGVSAPSGEEPRATNSTNRSIYNSGGLQDDSTYDAEVLWTGGALGVLQTLVSQENVGWLRAVVMKYSGNWTLTVWGKLSWGANPLAASTRGDGVRDGNQTDPLESEVVQFDISSWWANLNSAHDEAAPFLTVSSRPGGSGTTYFAGYGPSAGNNGSANVSYSTPYVLSVPISACSQFVYFNLSIEDSKSAAPNTMLRPWALAATQIDMVGSDSVSLGHGQRNASLTGSFTLERVGVSANTLLWAPANYTTLSNAPWGLKRYTGEPDFDILVLNMTSAASVTGIAASEGGRTYSVNLTAGLNNILVPRAEFLSSPLVPSNSIGR